MSTQVFPTLAGKGYDILRTPIWNTITSQNISGKEDRISLQTYPRYQWDLVFNFLRSDSTNLEFQSLLGFYNARNGSFDSFLYSDPDDYTITGQQIGTGNGSTLTYQLVKTLGGFVEPIYAPHTVSKVYVDGVDQVGYWTVSNWGTTTPGIVTFSGGHAPANTKAITADFTYYYPCRFVDDKIAFSNFMSQLWDMKKLSFMSII